MKVRKSQNKSIMDSIEAPQSQYSYHPEEQTSNLSGQSVHVALRMRPLNNAESNRGDTSIFKVIDQQNCQLIQKNGQVMKNFRFNYVINEKNGQTDVYNILPIDDYLDSALSGYSVTIFAYGQTGSGKTYTMAGQEDRFSQEVFTSDQNDGIIPRAIKSLWKQSQQKPEKYSIKASFTEIYNQQIKDLLNPNSGVLHCRWNPANGFFVEDLVIVDCTSVDDLISVLNEGIKNRRSGSHEMNKDSSRSHSIMTVYAVSETQSIDNRTVKRYGKMSFVDLAGSERLKESKSVGQMVKETGNINKSLFTLGKVIKALSDRKTKVPYIPYRDSKLTMLLMDSLGGTSKALMVACVSPSSAYFEETLSTLNYATRTMNIKNKPVVQMEEKDQVIYGLMRERDLLRLQNLYLRDQIEKSTGNKVLLPQMERSQINKNLPPLNKGTKSASTKPLSVQKYSSKEPKKQSSGNPMPKKDTTTIESSPKKEDKAHRNLQIQVSLNKVIQQYEFQMSRLQNENHQLRNAREVAQKNYLIVSNDNNALQIKLDNLQQLFIKNSSSRKNISQEYMNINLVTQNKMIKNKISDIQDDVFQMREKKAYNTAATQMTMQEKEAKVLNKNLKDRIDFLKKRDIELTTLIQKRKH